MAARDDEQRTIDVDVQDIDTRGRTLHGYAAVYGAVSDDLGGFRERIAPGAFASVLDADVRALLNHDPSQVLGRTRSGTLRLHDEQRGLRFEIDLPDSPLGENVKESVRRGDIDGASFRFKVDRDTWDDDLRTVESVKELKDVTVATFGAYPAASVELRTKPDPATGQEAVMAEQAENQTTTIEQPDEQRVERMPAGSLRVEERAEAPLMGMSLADAYRSRGFPAEPASLSWDEFRAVTWGGTIDAMQRQTIIGGPFGADMRYAWQVVPNVGVNAGVTSVQVYQQTARTLVAGTATIRAIDATSNKPEVASTLNVLAVPMKQVAAIESGIPNVYLQQPLFNTVVENDLRLSINDGLDELVRSAIAASGFQAPSTDNIFVSIRKAITTLRASGYRPDTVMLDPTTSQVIDTQVSGITGGSADFTAGAGNYGPANIYGLNRVESKVLAAPVVIDTTAHGKLYVSPITLARFEENWGKTNTSLVRLEGNAAYGTERTAAAVRIAAS